MSRFTRAVLTLAVTTLLVLLGASPVHAHAELTGTDPAPGSVLTEAPTRVTATYSERVSVIGKGPRLFDHTGTEAPVTASTSGGRLELVLPTTLADGTHVLVWEVLSLDGHVIPGSLEFSVGQRSPQMAAVPATGPDGGVRLWVGLTQSVAYAGALALLGLLLLLGAHTPRRLSTAAAGTAVLGGLGWLAAVRSDRGALVGAELVSTALLALGLVVAAAVVARRPRWARPVATPAAAAAVAAFALVGHARLSWVATVGDVVHLACAAVWFGGLLGCAWSLRHQDRDRAVAVLSRFSGLAAFALVGLAGSGLVLGWQVLGSRQALVDSAFGRTLLLKVAVVAVVLVIAVANRFWFLPRLRTTDHPPRSLRRLVAAELVGLLLVTGITGFLVQTSPTVPRPDHLVGTSTLDAGTVAVTLAPGTAGPNRVEVTYLGAAGTPEEAPALPGLTLLGDGLDLPSEPLTRTSPGRYETTIVLTAGEAWRARVKLALDPFDTRVLEIPLRHPPLS